METFPTRSASQCFDYEIKPFLNKIPEVGIYNLYDKSKGQLHSGQNFKFLK